MKGDHLYLAHIAEALERVREYTKGGRKRFEATPMAQDAVLRNLQTLAESSQRLSKALRARHPQIAWSAIAGSRNVLVHDYLGLDMDLVWSIVRRNVPELLAMVKEELRRPD